ncbi:MAG: 16S rRNA (cytosine(967)-C(5))-methyltransferase RsmB [Tyzzerella sp.]|nr:16S rRNA (cytosine(967)-C(5))-methyltransferase RsmB [Tyzzerella sp.]
MTRELVLGVLLEVTRDGEYSHISLRNVLTKYQYLDKRDRAFITRVVEGTLEHMIEIDYIINQFSKVKISKMKPVIRCILRSAVYQLKYMDSVPNSAACNEAVKLAIKKGFSSLKGFVNGVLRSIERNLDAITYPDEANVIEYLSIKYSMPEWILQKWLSEYDRETVETMLADFQTEKPTTIRVNRNVMSKEELTESLENQGVYAESHPYLKDAMWISSYDYLADLESFQKGAFHVQDISSMLVAHLANPNEGDNVIDVCAAPGGKSLHMAELLCGTGHVEARDLTDYKVNLIWDNIQRSGMQNIQAVRWDATILNEESVEKADIVVADLPCSGLGVLGKKTDLKYKMTEQTQRELVGLQRDILTKVKSYVKAGGTLLYSTCTVNEAENMGNVEWFLKENEEFELVSIKEDLCEELRKSVVQEGCLQLLPGVHKSDGFFIAKFKRVKHE